MRANAGCFVPIFLARAACESPARILASNTVAFLCLLPGGATLMKVVVGAIGSFVGARITSLYLPGRRLKQIFGVLIVVMTAYKLFQILTK